MMRCECTIPEGGFCERHGIYKSPGWVRLCNTRADYRKAWDEGRGPGQPRTTVDQKRGGPGTELKRIIAAWQKRFKWFDLSPRKGCQCEAMATWMDRLGPDGCEKNIDKILDKLEEEARKRKLTVPFRRLMAKKMVRRAIRLSR
jgi:hypothetical protein